VEVQVHQVQVVVLEARELLEHQEVLAQAD
jgi:hypothetical protein